MRWISVSSLNRSAGLFNEVTSSGITPHRTLDSHHGFTTTATNPYSESYSGSFFHPVNMETKLFQPCRTTITRCPNTNASSAHMIRKCHNLARWKPPIIHASHENWTGFQIARPVNTESTPSPIAEVYAC